MSAAINPPLPRAVRAVGEGFWNVRGSFRLGPIDLGTQASLVRLGDGRYVFLDTWTLDEPLRQWVESVVGGAGLAAIVNLHPFHTLHVRAMASMFPAAKLYGTSRHHARFPALSWEPERTEDAAFHERFDADFRFSVPRGVELVPANERLHFASVLALHRASRVLHVDDTLVYTKLPKPLRTLKRDLLRLHPTLAWVLEKRPGAATDFRAWTTELIELCRGADTLCAAHSAVLAVDKDSERSLADRVAEAVRRVHPILDRHERHHAV